MLCIFLQNRIITFGMHHVFLKQFKYILKDSLFYFREFLNKTFYIVSRVEIVSLLILRI